jgi:hypothetical protein
MKSVFFRVCFFFGFGVHVLLFHASSEDRVALLIGNSEYRAPAAPAGDTVQLPSIPMPALDLKLMESMLKKAGFGVTVLPNRTTAEMRADVQAFAAVHQGAPVVLFYYSGHGLQQDGVNYLAGVDAQIDISTKLPPLEQARNAGALSASDFEAALSNLKRRNAQEQLVPLEEILQTLNEISSNPGDRKIVLLDACRDPFAQSKREKRLLAMKGAGVIGKGSGGLVRPAERRGMFIGFSAAAGEVSLGRILEPSLFTRAFCAEALKPGVTLRDAFDNAAQKVYEESSHLIADERAAAIVEGRPIDGVLSQEAQTPSAYSVIFPGGFAFIPKENGPSISTGPATPKYVAAGHEEPAAPKDPDVLSGITVRDVDADTRKQFGVPEDSKGAIITAIDPNCAGNNVGLKVGDLINEVNREPIANVIQFAILKERLRQERKILLLISTKGNIKYLVVEPATLKDQNVFSGVTVHDANAETRKQFGIPENAKGAVISAIDHDCAGYEAGLAVGDLIFEINREPIDNLTQFAVLKEKCQEEKKVLVHVSTKGSTRYLVVERH